MVMDRRTFSFEGKKGDGTRVRGTIVARSKEEALSRLTQEYELEVHSSTFASSLFVFVSWLLGWCSLTIALSFYDATRALPFRISLLPSLTNSTPLLYLAFALFLFLLGAQLWKTVRK